MNPGTIETVARTCHVREVARSSAPGREHAADGEIWIEHNRKLAGNCRRVREPDAVATGTGAWCSRVVPVRAGVGTVCTISVGSVDHPWGSTGVIPRIVGRGRLRKGGEACA